MKSSKDFHASWHPVAGIRPRKQLEAGKRKADLLMRVTTANYQLLVIAAHVNRSATLGSDSAAHPRAALQTSVTGISSSCATRMALAFSVIVPTATNPSADMLMDMVSEIDVAEG